jgi:predicted TIM-barrel fold metal-dependent hydrolase
MAMPACLPMPRRRLFAAPLALLALGVTAAAAQSPPLVAGGAALDVHTHIASQFLTDHFTGGAGVPSKGADDLVARLDEARVARAVILSGAYFGAGAGLADEGNVAPENDFVATEVAKYPDRLVGFCGINPLFPHALAEIDRCLALPGMVGVKLHLEASGVDLTRPADVAALAAVFDRIAQRDAPVLIHVADPYGLTLPNAAFANLGEILSSHPAVRVVHAHCAGNTDDREIERFLRVGRSGYDPQTSWVDISACLTFFADAPLSERELIVWQLRNWGIGHVLFGSDYFAYDGATPKEALATLTKYPFTQAELDAILADDGSAWLYGPKGKP